MMDLKVPLNINIDQRTLTIKKIVANYAIKELGVVNIMPEDIYIVWFCKTLNHWKALASSASLGDYYFEITHNGQRDETYLDVYVKTENVCIPGED